MLHKGLQKVTGDIADADRLIRKANRIAYRNKELAKAAQAKVLQELPITLVPGVGLVKDLDWRKA